MEQIKDDAVVFIECTNTDTKVLVNYHDARRIANIRFLEHEGHIKDDSGSFHIAAIILETPEGFDAHHDNENTYDNRRKNLMNVTHKGHAHLTAKKTCGVLKRCGKWWKQWRHTNGATVSFTFEQKGEAIRFADWISYVMFGKEAVLYSPKHICSALAAYIIMKSGGELFKVTFIKRTTGELRKMTCRLKELSAHDEPASFEKNGLLVVTEDGIEGMRCIPIEGIKELTIDGKHFIVSEV